MKDKLYVSLAYTTVIMLIAKYSSELERNVFLEYAMAMETKFGDTFGFMELEVRMGVGTLQSSGICRHFYAFVNWGRDLLRDGCLRISEL